MPRTAILVFSRGIFEILLGRQYNIPVEKSSGAHKILKKKTLAA
jgi:hypothetical protein